ncbi:HIT domain-containing protein [Amycolatopsis sp. BJA-103]|uniref:HIT domain-containing protein n=1 Tax=unclassified Amycolatopsis TaxID=2618356 RepID=UPI0011AF969A|nr:HIT domain-containing protein [Amycolatopsis sp. BJA-103]
MIETMQCAGADFCEELSGSHDTSFTRFYEGDPPSRLICSTENLTLLADMSPLVLGHLLLLPSNHYLSFAQVLSLHDAEVRDFLADFVPLYRKTFGEPLILEHGSSVGQDSHACITHAHLHFLPVDGDLVDDLLIGDALTYRDLGSFDELALPPWPSSAYFLRVYRDECRVYRPTGDQKRQYLRSVVGAVLAIEDPEWDYAVVMRKADLRETMRKVGNWPGKLGETVDVGTARGE